jgi:hypothetical protein
VTPWVHDHDALEEHWFALMLLQPGRTISLAGVRIVARQVRDAFREEHEEACVRPLVRHVGQAASLLPDPRLHARRQSSPGRPRRGEPSPLPGQPLWQQSSSRQRGSRAAPIVGRVTGRW